MQSNQWTPATPLPSRKLGNSGTLPIEEHRAAILQHIQMYRVTFIQGDTGCGKSSMVPQFIYQQNPFARIFVTQPRRFAAISLARRVGQQLGNDQLVGYRLGRGERKESPETRITYCTTGYLVQLLSFNPGALANVTHVLLDEVHERTMDADMLLLLIKFCLRVHPGLKLVIMSATLQPKLFCDYFSDIHAGLHQLLVGTKRFPVTSVFLDQFDRLPGGYRLQQTPAYHALLQILNEENSRFSRHMEALLLGLIENLVQPDTCILVFLPGSGEIDSVQNSLRRLRMSCPVQVLPLLAMIPSSEQDKVMQPTLPGHCKVVLATNVAESSVTIPAVEYVIDSGLRRGVFTDKRTGQPALTTQWVSRASAKQRAGRAGRLGPGTVVRLYTEAFHDRVMTEFDDAEMEHASLETTVISTKLLFRRFGTVRDVLGMMISPPPATRVDNAFKQLFDYGALTSSEEDGEVTALGRLAVHLRLELPLVRLVFMAHAMDLLLEGIIMVACFAQGDLFPMPSRLFITDPARFQSAISQNFRDRVQMDDGRYSEILSNFDLYLEWLKQERNSGISVSRARAATAMAVDLCNTLMTEPVLPLDKKMTARLQAFQALAVGDDAGMSMKELFPPYDPYLMYFTITFAAAPNFLRARPAFGNPAGLVFEREMDPNRTAMLRCLPTEVLTGVQLSRLVDNDECRVTQAEVVESISERWADGLVEFAALERPHDPDEGRVLHDLDLSCKLFHQWYVHNNEKLVLLNYEDNMEGTELTLQGVAFPNALDWTVFGDDPEQNVVVKMNSRSPLALTADADCDAGDWNPPLAVAFTTIGMPSTNRLYASGVTILPFPAFGAAMMLLLARSVDQIRLLPTYSLEDPTNPRPVAYLASAAQFTCFGDGEPDTISFAPYFLDHTHVDHINDLRALLSRMMRGDPGSRKEVKSKVTSLLNELYWSREPTGDEFLQEAELWPWVEVQMQSTVDTYDYLPKVELKADKFLMSNKMEVTLSADVKKRDRIWHNLYREFRMLARLYLDRNDNILTLQTISSTFSLSGRKAKAKLKRLGFASTRALFESMPDLVTVVTDGSESWHIEGVAPCNPPDFDNLGTQKMPYENDKPFLINERLIADRKASWNNEKRRTWLHLRRKTKRALVQHTDGIPYAYFEKRYRYHGPMTVAKMRNLGFENLMEMLYGMPDVVSIRFEKMTRRHGGVPYTLYPTELLLTKAKDSPLLSPLLGRQAKDKGGSDNAAQQLVAMEPAAGDAQQADSPAQPADSSSTPSSLPADDASHAQQSMDSAPAGPVGASSGVSSGSNLSAEERPSTALHCVCPCHGAPSKHLPTSSPFMTSAQASRMPVAQTSSCIIA